jgi:hypothetical protein
MSADEARRRGCGFCVGFLGFWVFGFLGFLVLRDSHRGGGKVENLLLVFHFSIALVVGAVGMW